jgi:MtrB/PioB family decaheme-associated outer membrane protein
MLSCKRPRRPTQRAHFRVSVAMSVLVPVPTSVLVSILVSALLLTAARTAIATDYQPNYDKVRNDQWRCRLCSVDESRGTVAHINVGVISVSDDEARFGRDNGLNDDGESIDLNVNARAVGSEGSYWDLRATDLGFGSRRLDLTRGKRSSYAVGFSWREIPRNSYNRAGTAFVGNDRLRLAPGWLRATTTRDMDLSRLNYASVGTERRRGSAHLAVHLGSRVRVDGDVSRETKRGSQLTSNDFFYQTMATPLAINFRTDDVNASVRYQTRRFLARVGITQSRFSNRQPSYTWDNPYSFGPERGRKATEPDNKATRVFLDGRLNVGSTSLRFKRVEGELSQNESFLPVTTNDRLMPPPLPVTGLDGRVNLESTRLTLTSRVTRRIRIEARYRGDERVRERRALLLPGVLGDAILLPPRPNVARNFGRRHLRLAANVRLTNGLRLRLGTDRDAYERTFAEVTSADEDKRWIQLSHTSFLGLVARLRYTNAERDAGTFTPRTSNNPLTRRFYQADRDQTHWRGDITWQPDGRHFSIGAHGDVRDNEYHASILGLQRAADRTVGLDAAIFPSRRFSLSAFIERQRQDAHTRGEQAPDRPFVYESDDEVQTLGISLNADVRRLTLSLDYLLSDGSGRNTTWTPDVLSIFPELVSRHESLGLKARFAIRDDIHLIARWYRENFEARDWAIDGARPDTLPRLLSADIASPDYAINRVSLSITSDL